MSDRPGAIGNTPIVRRSRLAGRNHAELWVKLEAGEHRGDLRRAVVEFKRATTPTRRPS